ncbi:MAG: aldo/keto reductase [Anaerolineae bacterium]|nr:aldo/keto reductase [Anaerolineae bacterium]
MKYRNFGKTNDLVSVLGFGCMRFPTIGGDSANIDEEKSFAMLKYAMDAGVNYFDTAYPYHRGESERLVGRFFQQVGGRENVHIATKLPSWLVKSPDDLDRLLNEQLEKLQMDYIDYYLLHALNKDHWQTMKDNAAIQWAEKVMAAGKIRQLGFSFHDEYPVFEEILTSYDWSFAQVQYNYMDIENQAGAKGVHLAGERGVSIVVMEPLLGGRLANPPQPVAALWDQSETKRSPVDWALQWVWDQPEVSVILSGMSTLEQVQQNVESAKQAVVGQLTQAEKELISDVRVEYKRLSPIPCTNCQYCLPCTVDIKIPELFGMYNEARMYDSLESTRQWYGHVDDAVKASACIDCDACEPKCPQNIVISDWMVKVAAVMEEGKSFEDVM